MLESSQTRTVRSVREFEETISNNLLAAHDAIIYSRVEQTHDANKGCRKGSI